MRQLKMRLFAACLVMLMFVSPVNAFAIEELEATPITISSGILIDADRPETTFQASRTIYGEAEEGTIVCVTVRHKNELREYTQDFVEEVEVGSMGIFSVTFPLDKGRNFVTLTAEAEGYEKVEYALTIRRLEEEIKQELQKSVALPIGIIANKK